MTPRRIPQYQLVDLFFCNDGQVWVSGGHFTLEEVKQLPCVKAEQDGSWGGKFDRIIGVKHIWYRRGFLSRDLSDECDGATNGWEQIGVSGRGIETYKRKYKATELVFGPPPSSDR